MAQSVNSERGLRCSDSPSEAPCGLPCSLARSPHSRCRPSASFRFIILINSPNFEIYRVSSSMGPGARDKTCHFETAVHADSRHSEGHFGSGKILGRMRLRPMARFPGPSGFQTLFNLFRSGKRDARNPDVFSWREYVFDPLDPKSTSWLPNHRRPGRYQPADINLFRGGFPNGKPPRRLR